jgi:hypothetical protein
MTPAWFIGLSGIFSMLGCVTGIARNDVAYMHPNR